MSSHDVCKNNFEPVQVEYYSGYKTNECPVAFTFRERRWEISEIMDRCYEGGLKPDSPVVDYFKVKTNVPIGSIQRIVGHENRSTTEIYLHSIGNSELEAMKVLDLEIGEKSLTQNKKGLTP